MEKEFVPYELALQLKGLGFNEPCFGYWNIDPQLKTPAFNMVKPFEHKWCLHAPTFSQAFRWFRNKHNLLSIIDCYISTPLEWFVRIDKIDSLDYKMDITEESEDKTYPTYEEAELACLEKLIEIVKTK